MGVKSYILNDNEFLHNGIFINKFMPLERALNILNSNKIWFANPETWTDSYEKKFICAKYENGRSFAWRNRVFCTCFTNNAASEASWNAYSKDEICIQLTFYRTELIKVFEQYINANPHNQMYFDKVEYMQSKNINKALSSIPFNPQISHGKSIQSMEFKARLLLLKRRAFEYEQEYRAIIVKPKATKERGINVDIHDIHDLISSITIGPKVREDTFNMLKSIFVGKYGFNPKNIKQSHLYKSLPNDAIIKLK